MNATAPPNDLSEVPLWRLLVLLDDLERARGATSPESRRVAHAVAERLGVVTEFQSSSSTAPEPAHVG